MTRKLLVGGGIATPLFFVVAFGQVFTRDGFDLSRHALSQLATGGPGWIQIANFVVTGALFIGAAVGMGRVLREGRGRTWGPRLIGVFGAGLVAAGIFVTDPAGGFPSGSVPAALSWHGVLHGVAAVVAGVALLAASVVFAVRFFSRGRTGGRSTALPAVWSIWSCR